MTVEGYALSFSMVGIFSPLSVKILLSPPARSGIQLRSAAKSADSAAYPILTLLDFRKVKLDGGQSILLREDGIGLRAEVPRKRYRRRRSGVF